MRRRELLVGTAVALTPVTQFSIHWSMAASPLGRPPRVGLIAVGSLRDPPLSALAQGLADLGYIEGRTIAIEQPSAALNYEMMQRLALDLSRSEADVLVTWGATATRAAAWATRTIPIVMVAGIDPVQLGFAKSFAHPGSNVTGISTLAQELISKRVELMQEMVPGIPRIGVLLNPQSATEQMSLRLTEAAAHGLGIEIVVAQVRQPDEIEAAVDTAARLGAQGILTVPNTMLADNRMQVSMITMRHGLPAIFPDRTFVEAGGLMAYGPDFLAIFRRVAFYVDKILKGVNPTDLPIEQPAKFELVINLKTAKASGIAVPPSLLARADEVIE